MKILIISILILIPTFGNAQTLGEFRWVDESWNPAKNESLQTHFGWNGFGVYSFAKAKTESKWKAALLTTTLILVKEGWDSYVPAEKYWIIGGAGGSTPDIVYGLGGMTFGIGLDYLIPGIKITIKKLPLEKIPIIRKFKKKKEDVQ